MIFRQLFDSESSTFTYLLADEQTREAVLIDPVFEHHRRDVALVRELDLRLLYSLDTHCHADHVTGAWLLRETLGCQIALAAAYRAKGVDLALAGGEKIVFGQRFLDVLATPGHTDGCMSFVLDNQAMVFTGDCLLVRGTGRTDFQKGDASLMYSSIKQTLFSLPGSCLVYPGHDYSGRCNSSIQEEMQHNPRIGGAASESDFIGFMDNLHLPHPKKIAAALPANLKCGQPDDHYHRELADWGPVDQTYAGIRQIDPLWVSEHYDQVTILDVREKEEFQGELGHIPNALHIPLREIRQRLDEIPREKPVVTVCRSGRRSAQATVALAKLGFSEVANVKDGMLAWRDLGLMVVERMP